MLLSCGTPSLSFLSLRLNHLIHHRHHSLRHFIGRLLGLEDCRRYKPTYIHTYLHKYIHRPSLLQLLHDLALQVHSPLSTPAIPAPPPAVLGDDATFPLHPSSSSYSTNAGGKDSVHSDDRTAAAESSSSRQANRTEKKQKRRIKVGFVSAGYYRNHPIAKMVAGLMQALPRDQYEVGR